MKKIFLVTGAILVLGLAMAGLAYANEGPHGGYTAITDACAGCHRAHTATGPNLLIESSTFDLCTTCHAYTGTGADTNVMGGIYTNRQGGGEGTVDAPLNGGGFTEAWNYVTATFTDTTSSHLSTGVITQAWGADGTIGVPGDLDTEFDCASCHDPHGSTNYRIIREVVNTNPVAVPLVDEGVGVKDYTVEQWDYDDTGGTGDSISQLCAACHGAYHATAAGSGSVAPYTHRIDMSYVYGLNDNPEDVGMDGYTLPLADDVVNTLSNEIVLCTTCHLAHGSSAAQGPYSEGATLPPLSGDVDSSALLRLGDRGVCEVCHQK